MLGRSLLLAAALLFAASAAPADSVTVGSLENPVEIPGIGAGSSYATEHTDAEPWKGSAFVYTKNTGLDPWGGMHFEIYQIPGGGDATTVFFETAGAYEPVSSQDLYSYQVGVNNAGLATLDLFFWNDPVNNGQVAIFEIFTNNQAAQTNFGLLFYPIQVPEPATIGLLGLGALGLLRRKK